MHTNRYKAGDWLAICEICGLEFFASELLLNWKKQRVCPACYEERNPFETLRVPKENPSVPWARPDGGNPEIPDAGVGIWQIGYTFVVPPRRDIQALTFATDYDGTYAVKAKCLYHRLTNGDTVTVTGASDSAYNGEQTITVLDADHFLYSVSSAPAANEDPASGVEVEAIVRSDNPVTFNRWLTQEWHRRVFFGETVT